MAGTDDQCSSDQLNDTAMLVMRHMIYCTHSKVITGETRANDWILQMVYACHQNNETVSHSSG